MELQQKSMGELLDLIVRHDEAILHIYRETKLSSIRDDEYTFQGFDFFTSYTDIFYDRFPQGENQFASFDEIAFASDQLIYFTAHLFLYKPFIERNTEIDLGGNNVNIFIPSLPGKRYDMYADICFQKAYNFWDRIGDLIAVIVAKNSKKDIYFAPILQKVPQLFQSNEHFKWLDNFSKHDYKKMKEKRNRIVHYFSINTELFNDRLSNSQDKAKLDRLQTEREALADYFLNHSKTVLIGFYHTLKLLDIIVKAEEG
jgi:hypothetical protein